MNDYENKPPRYIEFTEADLPKPKLKHSMSGIFTGLSNEYDRVMPKAIKELMLNISYSLIACANYKVRTGSGVVAEECIQGAATVAECQGLASNCCSFYPPELLEYHLFNNNEYSKALGILDETYCSEFGYNNQIFKRTPIAKFNFFLENIIRVLGKEVVNESKWSDFLLCYTPHGVHVGELTTCLNVCAFKHIPVINLGDDQLPDYLSQYKTCNELAQAVLDLVKSQLKCMNECTN